MEQVEEIPLRVILDNNMGPGVQYRNSTIVINTRSDQNFNKVYREAVKRMNVAIDKKVNEQIDEIAKQVNSDITDEIEQTRRQIEDHRLNN